MGTGWGSAQGARRLAGAKPASFPEFSLPLGPPSPLASVSPCAGDSFLVDIADE